jgi:alanine racemase
VLLLGPCLPAERAAAVEADFVVTVSSAAEAEAYAAIGPCRINFKIDTGMGRIGCWHEEAVCNLERIRKLPNITVHSLSTHLPSADEDAHFTKHQLDLFASLQNQVHQIFPSAKIHTRNSAGIFGFPSRPGEVVRAGLALYGSASPEDHQHRLLPALTWKARIILVRDIPAGRTISYGRTFVSKHPMRVASVSAGYADGFPRQASGRGAQVLVQGQRCAVLGRVTMDQIVIDVSELQNVTLGEEVVFVGRQGHEEITANELARHADTISWHLFTGISPRVQRVYI